MTAATHPGAAARRVRSPSHVNEVTVVGRLADGVTERTLPSGDRLVDFRVVVDRPEQRGTRHRSRTTVDTLDCVVWTGRLRRQVTGWTAGDLVQVTGSLRRRFWRASSGSPGSRYEIEVEQARRVHRVTMAG